MNASKSGTIDEGYTKYQVDWTRSDALDDAEIATLDRWRRALYAAGLVGHDDELGVGYGNISVRSGDSFLVSGTQTGHIVETDGRHYARVTAYDLDTNTVRCLGPVQASSEALTHAAIYAASVRVGAVVHVHDNRLWKASLGLLPTTRPEVAYGTPAMAREFARLLAETSFDADGLAAMAGHDGGLVAIGATLEEASVRILDYAGR